MENDQQILNRLASGDVLEDSEIVRRVIESYGLEATRDADSWQLSHPLELLDPRTLESLITDEAKLKLSSLDLHWSLDSTNTYVLARGTDPNFHGFACMAERQTAGKGRRGRHWVSPFGKNIYLSLGWQLPASRSLEGLSLAVGCAAARAIEAQGGDRKVNLKWPNDLLIDGGKTGGILVELGSATSGHHHVVVGVGINLQLSTTDSKIIDQAWSVVGKVSRNRIAAALLSELVTCLAEFEAEGFAPFRAEWNGRDAFAGQEVRLISAGNEERGVARGVDESGNLLLQRGDEIKQVNAGEVSLRGDQR